MSPKKTYKYGEQDHEINRYRKNIKSDGGIGSILKRLREKAELTIVELSKLSGVSKSTIQRIENEKSTPKLAILEELRPYLGFSYEMLIIGVPAKSDLATRITAETLKLHSNALEWLGSDHNTSERANILNQLFSKQPSEDESEDESLIELLLDSFHLYLMASYGNTPKQYENMDFVKFQTIQRIQLVMESLVDPHDVLGTREQWKAIELSNSAIQKMKRKMEEQASAQEHINFTRRQQAEIEDNEAFVKEAEEYQKQTETSE